MKLLILTQAVDLNNPILGFFHRWVEEFAKHCEQVTVICLERGEHHLPANVRVLSLGKESGKSRMKYLWRFYKYIWQERESYDKVFVHMNPEYVLLGGWWWRLAGKKIALWYVHRQIDLRLRLAEKFVDIIFTASRESFRLKSAKVKIVGHGIDVKRFRRPSDFLYSSPVPVIISIGRITRIKRLEILLSALKILKDRGLDFRCYLIGPVITLDDKIYQKELESKLVASGLKEVVRFDGPVSYDKLPPRYWAASLHINLAPTGGIDKAVLESLVAGSPSLVYNRAFEPILGPASENLLLKSSDIGELAEKMYSVLTNTTRGDWLELARVIAAKTSLDLLISAIIKAYE